MEEWGTKWYFWKWNPLSYEDKELLCFGMPLFGFYIPYIGITTIEGEKVFMFEWFLRGWAIVL